MRVFKIADHNLQYWQNSWNYQDQTYAHHVLVPGIKICAISKLETLGVVTHVGEATGIVHGYRDQPNRHYIEQVTVLWLTGPRKGQTQIKKTNTLANYDSYRAAVMAHVAELDELEADAAKTGL